jgi:hypothetical protein
MAEKRTSPARLSETTNVGAVRKATEALPHSRKRSRRPESDYIRTPKSSSAIPRRSRCFNNLVLQLSVDPLVRSIKYVDSLAALGRRVKVEMLVAERDDGRFAYDIVDERPLRDLDAEGLVLIALHENSIGLIETDRTQVNGEPRASNCVLIWKHRNYPIDASARTAVDRALRKHGSSTIRELGEITGVPNPIKIVCALVWQGVLAVDLARQLDSEARVSRRTASSTPSRCSTRAPSNRRAS